tara:strand:- start:388 stop:558 length:171 start_codon:yes stop_codon:yes gene_type:complete
MFDKFKMNKGYYYRLFFGMLRFGILWDQNLPNRSIYLILGIWKPEITISLGWRVQK